MTLEKIDSGLVRVNGQPFSHEIKNGQFGPSR